jgi:periplasmic divalent cation tolerance protein
MDFVLAYITAKDKDQAMTIGRTLVEEHLAACVNVIDGMTSVYRWDGEICTDSEAVLIAKTSSAKFGPLADRVKQLHSYTCPCVVSIPIAGGGSDYLNWLSGEINAKD